MKRRGAETIMGTSGVAVEIRPGQVYLVNVQEGPANDQVQPGEHLVQTLGRTGGAWRGFVVKDKKPVEHRPGDHRYCSFGGEDVLGG